MRKLFFIVSICICLALCSCGKVDTTSESDNKITIEFPEGFGHETEEKAGEISEKADDRIPDYDITTEKQMTTEAFNPREDIIIALDPGHQAPSVDMSATEPNAPESSVMKTKATGGTSGKFTGVGEYELNLTIAKKVRDRLSGMGYNVIMTRENNETAISNMERAKLANDAHANISVRIHANGSDDSSTNGALVLVGSQSNMYVGHLYDESYRLGQNILDTYCESTGMKNLGIQTNDTMTGINWSEIPVIILEMGFMSNELDDRNMEDASYQEKMVNGIVDGIEKYFGMDSVQEEVVYTDNSSGLQTVIDTEMNAFSGGSASVYVEDLTTGVNAEIGSRSMVAASLIKLYVAGCIYELQEKDPQNALSDVDDLIGKMLTVSDNDATNTLVTMLGNGDASVGMQKVNAYCSSHGLSDTSMGRLMLDFSTGKENYTSVRDSAAFLRSVYYGRLSGSEKIMSYLKQQDRTNKIPAGVPQGVETANKTGELDNVENDVAIVFAEGHPYVISVMTSDLQDASAARSWMVDLSKEVYDCMVK